MELKLVVDVTRVKGLVSGDGFGVAAGVGPAVAEDATALRREEASGEGVEEPDIGGVGKVEGPEGAGAEGALTGCSEGAVRLNMASI